MSTPIGSSKATLHSTNTTTAKHRRRTLVEWASRRDCHRNHHANAGHLLCETSSLDSFIHRSHKHNRQARPSLCPLAGPSKEQPSCLSNHAATSSRFRQTVGHRHRVAFISRPLSLLGLLLLMLLPVNLGARHLVLLPEEPITAPVPLTTTPTTARGQSARGTMLDLLLDTSSLLSSPSYSPLGMSPPSFLQSPAVHNEYNGHGGHHGLNGPDKRSRRLSHRGTLMLYYSSWYCAGLAHKRASLSCLLAEAAYLGRGVVIPRTVCLSSVHASNGDPAEVGFDRLFDVASLARHIAGLRFASSGQIKKVLATAPHVAVVSATEPSSALKTNEARLLWRNFVPPAFWYDVCTNNPALTSLRKRYSKLVKRLPPPLATIAHAMVAEMGPFVLLHVRRGDKAQDKRRWPNLKRDTRGKAILANPKVAAVAPKGTTVYLATDERDLDGVFAPLFSHWRVFTLRNFSADIVAATNGLVAYEHAAIDYDLQRNATHVIETFNDLTSDSKHGN
eukprot:m.30362 g.30362  ORF g.30362 m.30362 type:complete len:505 (+) comp9424_c0_seq1:63-1577(+)